MTDTPDYDAFTNLVTMWVLARDVAEHLHTAQAKWRHDADLADIYLCDARTAFAKLATVMGYRLEPIQPPVSVAQFVMFSKVGSTE